jgi:hypothetical protein
MVLIVLPCTLSAAPIVETEIPLIEDVAIATKLFPVSSKNSEDAISSVQKAAFLQWGVSQNYKIVRTYTLVKVTKVTDKVKEGVAYVVDNYTPIKSEQVFFLIAGAYVYSVKKEYTQNFGMPFTDNVKQYVTVGENRYATGISVEL